MQNPLYLVKVEPNANNNKYYELIPDGEDYFIAKYGRIGVGGYQTKRYPIGKWDSTLKSKIRKGYVDQSRLVAETTIVPNKKKEYLDINNPSIAQIVARLQSMARQAIKDNYTINSQNVTQAMIDEAQLILNNLIKHIPKEKPSDNLVKYEGNNSQQTNRRTNISLTAKDGDTLNKSADISSNLDAPCIVCGLREEVDSGMCEDCRNDAIKHLNAFQRTKNEKENGTN